MWSDIYLYHHNHLILPRFGFRIGAFCRSVPRNPLYPASVPWPCQFSAIAATKTMLAEPPRTTSHHRDLPTRNFNRTGLRVHHGSRGIVRLVQDFAD
ncbi:hypothetical protein EDD29_3095 [Actinocorallia herbida]|uniref:Uncharacterized protein n=1 Tax=Actinocorallia herbida TaxID=58109 RepID=A0A3N1CW72_9ACTN|nr:hypothetical protein EDD29_3095 [Actinocorallia herbida]